MKEKIELGVGKLYGGLRTVRRGLFSWFLLAKKEIKNHLFGVSSSWEAGGEI